eukprot:m.37950 g.37950  ORF g.37950 m.37950 type:complete len:64 (-) comp10169_c0_seq4:298-489(-)
MQQFTQCLSSQNLQCHQCAPNQNPNRYLVDFERGGKELVDNKHNGEREKPKLPKDSAHSPFSE